MAAAHEHAPRFAAATATTFTVDTTDDSDLATAGGTACVDAATGACSLRAAVDAANNLAKPVRIVLASTNYPLSTAATLVVTNPGGTSIVGHGASKTKITGAGSGIFKVGTVSNAPAGLLFLTGVTATGGSTTVGGAIYLDNTNSGSAVVLDSAVLTGNTATVAGGGIYAADYTTIYARNTKITNNVAPDGAGMYEYWSDVQLIGCTVTGNSTPSGMPGYGGGITDEYGVMAIIGGSVSNNSAGDATDAGSGGGIDDSYGTLTMTGVHLDHNTARDGGDGGGLLADYDHVDITRGTVSHDTASGANASGGGVYVEYGSQLGLHAVAMVDDQVEGPSGEGYGGGAIYDYGYDFANQVVVDSGSKITGADQAAIYAYAYEGQVDLAVSNSTLSADTDTGTNGQNGAGCGGAVCAYAYEYGTLHLAMTADTVTGNSSLGKGGAGAVSVFSYDTAQATTVLRSTTFADNSAGAGGYGGAVLFWNNDNYSPQSIQMSANHFTGNRAGSTASGDEGYGGAVALNYYAVLTDHGSTFSGNKALGPDASGGAVYDGSDQSASFTATTFTHNSAGSGADSGYGGAIYTDDDSGDEFTEVTISANSAASQGGGVYSDDDGYELAFNNSTLSGNTAGSSTLTGSGGAIYADDALLSMQNSTVSGNQARGSGGQGGGIWESGSRFGLRYSTVSSNTAASGGGIYADGEGGTLLGSIASGNHAVAGGAEQDCASGGATSTLSSLGGNVLGQRVCVAGAQASDKMTGKPGLTPLADNGGPTRTMRLDATSPALHASTFLCPVADGRGQPRPATRCDAGAYQRAPGTALAVSPSKGRGGLKVTIKGTGFTFARHVLFGKKAAAFTVLSDTRIVTHVPRGLSGKIQVSVLTPDGSASKAVFAFPAAIHAS